MDSPTLVALCILGGVFLTMFAAILKSGVEGAIKMWGVMGAVTGVAIGAITSYYFADQAFQSETRSLRDGYTMAAEQLKDIKTQAGEYQTTLSNIESSLANSARITPAQRARLLVDISNTKSGLREIEQRQLQVAPDLLIDAQQFRNITIPDTE